MAWKQPSSAAGCSTCLDSVATLSASIILGRLGRLSQASTCPASGRDCPDLVTRLDVRLWARADLGSHYGH